MSLQEMDDIALMLAYQSGRHEAFDALYERHKGGLYRYFLRQGLSRDMANELFQDVWMKLIHARDSYRAGASFSSYLYSIAHNRLVDYFRAHQPLTGLDAEPADCDEALPESRLQQQQMQLRLKQGIAGLPEEQRSTLLLQKEAGLSLEQIAAVTGTSRETVKSRLRYAMNRLKQVLS